MRTVPLGPNDTISEIMLGTMTFGTQTSEADSHRQMDMAAEAGVTWLDTAEMYPVNPVTKETLGRTEEIVGNWLAKGNAGRLRVATKHLGPGDYSGEITAETIPAAIEASLKRLQSETIDLYQLHWPNRGSYHFRKNWTYRPEGDRAAILQNLADCTAALEREVARGTIRSFGLSNETTWGLAQWLRLAGDGSARPVSVQNEYSLLCRFADTDLAELMYHDQITMLAFSPLATGLLTGKYQGGAIPEGSRRSISPGLSGRWSDRVDATVAAYLELARTHGVDPVHMALAWLQSRPFACSAIIGATTVSQLDHALKGAGLVLSEELVAAVDEVHRTYPAPY
ncbi:aldo/keto reductase [Jannaschia seohaensis]|uniref:Predicted oxidoreductase n=1 Tax=Jannaschia seohaensis TaxID=475081 RepID=A0A2Y9AGN0_9RHOB|nr:aldo/keto reductase [Jannaschia seohaensis]PWJ21289.1 aryl-alcohol dehydrogenase-like predicted oxidoreductase [Jannaschia seohaensis]SSA41699.1 Predicted oxidoreductase [Jannaschia seohaensis]